MSEMINTGLRWLYRIFTWCVSAGFIIMLLAMLYDALRQNEADRADRALRREQEATYLAYCAEGDDEDLRRVAIRRAAAKANRIRKNKREGRKNK